MTNADKAFLRIRVKELLAQNEPHKSIIERLERMGFKKATIKTRIKSYSE